MKRIGDLLLSSGSTSAINRMRAYCSAGTEGQQIATFVIGGLKRGNITGTDF
jgi:hypothetical protein